MTILNPNEPNMVNINGKNIDAGYGIVTPNGQPLRSKKGNALSDNLKKRQKEMKKHKDGVISQFIQDVIAKTLSEDKVKAVKSEADVQKLLDKNGIGVLRQDHDKFSYCVIVKSRWLKPPVVLSAHSWKWK